MQGPCIISSIGFGHFTIWTIYHYFSYTLGKLFILIFGEHHILQTNCPQFIKFGWLLLVPHVRSMNNWFWIKSHFFGLFGLPRTFVKTLFSWVFGFPRYLRPLSYTFLWVSGRFLHLASSGTLFLIDKLQHSKDSTIYGFGNYQQCDAIISSPWIYKSRSMRTQPQYPPHCSCGLLAAKISNAMYDLDPGGLYGPY